MFDQVWYYLFSCIKHFKLKDMLHYMLKAVSAIVLLREAHVIPELHIVQ